MSSAWFDSANQALERVCHARKGRVIRRAGSMSLETEVSIPYGKWDVIYGFDLASPGEPRLALHIRLGAAPELVRKVQLWPDEQDLFAPPRKVNTRPLQTTRPPDGFHLEYRRSPNILEGMFYRILGPRIEGDPRRQGWFFLETCLLSHLDQHIPSLIRNEIRDFTSLGPDSLRIMVTPYQFRATMEPVYDSESLLDRFFDASTALLDASRSLGTRSVVPTVQRLDIRSLLVHSTGWCGVCGECLEGTVVHCDSCGAPHHTDCWSYLGRCSIYGCGGRRLSV